MKQVYTIFFSATETTRCCVGNICRGLGFGDAETPINLADDLDAAFPEFKESDVVVIGSPVYGGRLPVRVAEAFNRLKGNGAAAVAAVVFGNRDYDDALLELTDILEAAGFRIAGAGAFIGQHSIFPKVGASRPDDLDVSSLIQFGRECRKVIDSASFAPLSVKGSRPYKNIDGVPLHPKGNESKCVKCGACADACPVDAIPADKPWTTDTSLCITCGRCIHVCPEGARRHSGLMYGLIGSLFRAAFSRRKNPEWTTGLQEAQ